MKKLFALTLLFIAILSAVHAQVINTVPVYDNINKEKVFKQERMPQLNAQYALIETNRNNKYSWLVDLYGPGPSIDIKAHTVTSYPYSKLSCYPFPIPRNNFNKR